MNKIEDEKTVTNESIRKQLAVNRKKIKGNAERIELAIRGSAGQKLIKINLKK